MTRDIDAEYNALMDELQEAVNELDPHGCGLTEYGSSDFGSSSWLRKYMSRAAKPVDRRRTGPDALN